MILVNCWQGPVTAQFSETDAVVTVTDFETDAAHETGDCASVAVHELRKPIGDRDLVVNGERWRRLDDSGECTFAFVAPGRDVGDCAPVDP